MGKCGWLFESGVSGIGNSCLLSESGGFGISEAVVPPWTGAKYVCDDPVTQIIRAKLLHVAIVSVTYILVNERDSD